jgi:hypothetical protein
MKKFTVNLEIGAVVHKEIKEEYGGMVYTFIGDDDTIEVRDEYHSMHDLYEHRMALTIALFHAWYELDAQGMSDFGEQPSNETKCYEYCLKVDIL